MLQIASLFAWMGLGFALRRARPAAGSFAAIDRAIVWFSLPATVLLAIHGLAWDPSDWIPVSMSWIVFLAGAGLMALLGRVRGWPSSTTGALVMTAALGNTSFVGFPLLRALQKLARLIEGVGRISIGGMGLRRLYGALGLVNLQPGFVTVERQPRSAVFRRAQVGRNGVGIPAPGQQLILGPDLLDLADGVGTDLVLHDDHVAGHGDGVVGFGGDDEDTQ